MPDDLFVLKKAVGEGPMNHGEWRDWYGNVLVCCPECKGTASIRLRSSSELQHTITDDGVISPSVQCPVCPWHVFARLEGWNHA